MRRGHAEITADKILDSRDLIARFDYLTNEREALADAAESEKDDAQGALAAWDADHAEELKALEDIIDEGTREFPHGETKAGSDYLSGTYERADDDPNESNPFISGYLPDMIARALDELTRHPGSPDAEINAARQVAQACRLT